jgi:predicted oxidoreductase
VTAIIIGWLLHGHLNPTAIVGTAAGTMIRCFIVALGIRLTRPRHH